MRTRLLAAAAASLIATATTSFATAPPRHAPEGGAPRQDGVKSVTDASGNAVSPETYAGSSKPGASAAETARVPDVQRGQSWWPYPAPLAPYSAYVGKRAEEMTEEEIQVNGLVLLDVRDPIGSLQQVPKPLLLDEGSQLARAEGYYLVKIRGFSRNQEQVDALEAAGAVLGEYMNVNTYIARIPAGAYDAVKALPFVTYVGDYQPAYKISPRIGLELIPQTEVIDPSTGLPKPWLFEMTLHKGVNLQETLDALASLGVLVDANDVIPSDDMTLVLARTSPENVVAISQIPGVKWIAEKPYAHLMASAASPATIPMVLQNNGTFTTNTATGWKLWNAGIDGNASGTAQIVTVMDTGLNTKMEHFSQDTVNHGTIGASHRKVVGYDVFGGDQCVTAYTTADGGHGTFTSQHAVGSISNMTSNPDVTHTPTINFDDGIARDGKVYFQDIGIPSGALSPPADLGPSVSAAIAKGSFIQSHSWGAATNTYTSTASLLDTAIFNNPNFVVTTAAGNSGTIGGSTINDMCTGKNIICVGGNDVASPNQLFEDCLWDGVAACSAANDLGSSRGPVAASGRIKPDIMTYVAFSAAVGGENEAANRPSAMCQTDATKTVYWDFVNSNGFGGTSFAAPEVAGLAALVRDYFQAGFYPTGAAVPANVLTPSGSLVKAVILASGEDMSTTASPTNTISIGKRYSNDVGYGRANLPGALHVGGGAPFLWVQNNDALGDGATKTFFYTINGNSIPLRVMMVYYDAAGNALQKNANLKVTIGANVYWGNNFSGGWSTTATTTQDATNTTEGVFLDSAHGLPSSGTVRVDVIGFNDPGGMSYSLAVVGDVASQAVTQVSLDSGHYNCSQKVKITVNDVSATSPVSVTVTSRDAGNAVIGTQVVSCAGSGGVFVGNIHTGSQIDVVDGGTITATYLAVTPAVASIDCTAAIADGGFLIGGGCDNATGTDDVTGPLSNGGSNEFYNKYMDAGEYSSYTFGFVNQTGVALTDATVTVSFSGAGASKMTVYNNPVHVGNVPVDGLAGAVFQVFTDPSAAGLTSVNLDFDITSPADGWETPTHITQVQLLQSNDVIARQASCAPYNTALTPWVEAQVTGGSGASQWRWSGSATTPATVSSEVRVDGACGSATANAAAMTGNSGTAANFGANADSFLLTNFQPVLRGNGPSGQPYHYVWKWHSFYHASELLNNQGGVWGAFYNDQWNSAVNPTGDQAAGFPIAVAYFYQTIFDYVGTWNWDVANGGTPDDPRLDPTSGGAPNQLFITFTNDVTGLATNSTWFSYGHEHLDDTFFGGAVANRDIALDNDRLVYDEYYTAAQAGASCGGGGQVGVVAFDQFSYDQCPSGSAVLSVLDPNATSPLTVTVTSPGTGDSETVTLTGTAPYFSGTIAYSTQSGVGANNATLFILPSEVIQASYTDASPAGSSTASANTGCAAGSVVYTANTQISDNGDNDTIADNGETVTIDIAITNNLATPLANTKVTIYSNSPNIDCIPDNQALYGTVAAGATTNNPAGDRFSFHVAPQVACSDFNNPPSASFIVVITGDGIDGASSLQTFSVSLDLDYTGAGTNYTQNFSANPNWTTGATPDDGNTCPNQQYSNSFHWCAACGNAGAGYGAWTGNSAFGTAGQNYPDFDSSTLYSPVFAANGAVTLQFQVAYRTEASFDGAIVQYKLGTGNWTNLGFTTPAQAATTTQEFCSPLLPGVAAWHGTGVLWTTTNAASVPSSLGQSIQFRWRLGTDESANGTTYGGYGVDNITITNLRQVVCEPTRNNGLPGCIASCTGQPNGTACDDGSACSQSDTCQGGLCVGGSPVICTASDQCHDVGVCNSGTGVCSNPAKPNGTACNDTNACTQTDTCQAGTCTGSNPVVCTALDQCHDVGTCNTGTGVCTNPNKANGSACNDGNACTNGDACQSGSCQAGSPVVCTPLDQCHDAGTCNTGTGICSNPNKQNGSACNDTNACTQTDTCQGGSCSGSNPVTCTASDQCHLVGTCNTGTGVCSDPPKPNGSACFDGNACTQTDTCQAGSCVGSNPVVCTASDQCHVAGTCNTGTGVCSNPTAPNGNPCNDGNACTQTDTCQTGACAGSNPVVCTASDQCHVAGTCNTGTGVCSNPTAPNGNPCNDGNACTQTDTCQTGACAGSNPVVCTASDQCHVAGTCNTGTGVCSNPTAPNGNPCTDGNVCTVGDVCTSGACTPGGPAPPPAEVNNSLTLTHSGVSASVAWTDGPGPFNAYRGLRPGSGSWSYNQTCLASNTTAPVVDAAMPPVGSSYFYLVTRLDACGESIPGRDSLNVPEPNPSPCP